MGKRIRGGMLMKLGDNIIPVPLEHVGAFQRQGYKRFVEPFAVFYHPITRHRIQLRQSEFDGYEKRGYKKYWTYFKTVEEREVAKREYDEVFAPTRKTNKRGLSLESKG